MKPKHRTIATRQWTRSAVAYRTRSAAMIEMPLSMRGWPPLQKRDGSYLQKKDGSSLQKQKLGRPLEVLENIVGHRISHGWKEGDEPVTQWNAIVLDQLPTNPPLYLLKYNGIDCVYGLELHHDERILQLKILPNKVSCPRVTDTHLTNSIVGRAVTHEFEGTNGSKDGWRGVVLNEVPIMKTWFYVTYDKDPVLYIYHLLDDYIAGNLHIMPERPPVEVTSGVGRDVVIGKCVQQSKNDGTIKTGKIVYQVPTKPSMYFVKFEKDTLIYVYDVRMIQ
ncbi:spindlin-2-like [Microtus ochrogaster]|uniref:Spindlin-2-like n=1 Tax=Microtus ochrogaster TaxID=79684 RepID=A0ABM0KDT1_MICOH|nr:spindlin-2-like [Microtus ochrogaster]